MQARVLSGAGGHSSNKLCSDPFSVVTLKYLEAPTIRRDVARLFNEQPLLSDLPSCHPVTSQAAQDKTRQKTSRNETTLRLEIS